MDNPGDVYAIALSDDRLRAGLIALRALAAVVDAPRPTATADRPLAVART